MLLSRRKRIRRYHRVQGRLVRRSVTRLTAFEYDGAQRLAQVKVFKDGQAAAVTYLHNALGQRTTVMSGMAAIVGSIPALRIITSVLREVPQ